MLLLIIDQGNLVDNMVRTYVPQFVLCVLIGVLIMVMIDDIN